MNCNPKSMLKMLAVALGLAATAYVALPQFREFVLAGTPFLLSLICPLGMIGMMFMMKGSNPDRKRECAAAAEPGPAPETAPAQIPGVAAANAPR